MTAALEAERAPSWRSNGVTLTLPSFVVADLGVDLDLSGKGKLHFYQLIDHLCLQCLQRGREPRLSQRGFLCTLLSHMDVSLGGIELFVWKIGMGKEKNRNCIGT